MIYYRRAQGRPVAGAAGAGAHVQRRALVARALRHVPGLVGRAPRAAAGLLPQQRRRAARPRRRVPRVEHQVQEADARGRLPLPVARHERHLRQVWCCRRL